mgnify:CR=1 FL=1
MRLIENSKPVIAKKMIDALLSCLMRRPETAGVSALIEGICAATPDDPDRLARGAGALDGFYAHFTRRRGE